MAQRIIFYVMIALLIWPITSAIAQEAPEPRKQPRIPVSREALPIPRKNAPVSHDISGQALIIDGEKLRIGDVEMRLFGVVPPQLSANFGPQARAELDAVTAGNALHCQIRDRDRDGYFLATCRNATNLDPALELLKRGLAVAARGSLANTELATSYITAEQYAQTQKIGLWSVTLSSPTPAVAAPTPAPVPVAVVAPPEPSKVDVPVAKAEPAAVIEAKKDKIDKTAIAIPVAVSTGDAAPKADTMSFFARYQLFLTGIVMLVTALSISGVLFIQRHLERREEMRALAAALRGELMAARALCQGRLKAIMTEADDRTMTWPRIRSTLYQAYVGRIGWLGAELARQVVSLYGQSNDYAAYYHPAEAARSGDMPKRHALQTMMQHIEEVLPKLAVIEETGRRLPTKATTSLAAPRSVHVPIHLDSTPLPVASLAAPSKPSIPSITSFSSTQSVAPSETEVQKVETQIAAPVQKPTITTVKTEAPSAPKALAPEPGAVKDTQKEIVKKAVADLPKPIPPAPSSSSSIRTESKPLASSSTGASKASDVKPVTTKTEIEPKGSESPLANTKFADVKTPAIASTPSPVPLWDAVRKFARDHLPEKQPAPLEEALPDYAALIEEDMSNFTFGESDYDYYDESSDDSSVTKFGGSNRG